MKIPQMQPFFDDLETTAILKYLEGKPFLTEYRETSELETQLSNYIGSKHAIMVSNGTLSLVAMLAVLNIGPGDKVYVPNYTMIATFNAVRMVGADVILVDVEPETLCIDINDLQAKMSKDAKAIFFMSANGRYPLNGLQKIQDFAQQNNLFLLEDSAQSLGSFFPDGEHIGTKGTMGSFSFSVPKVITMGQGGCIVTNEDSLAEKIRKFKDFGRSKGGVDFHPFFGINLKITDLQSVIGKVQLTKLAERIARKKEIARRYKENLANCIQVEFFKDDLVSGTPWFIDTLVTERESLINFLEAHSIGSRRMYPPINLQPSVAMNGSFPVSENVGLNGLWLPSYVQISDQEIDLVCETIMNFYARH